MKDLFRPKHSECVFLEYVKTEVSNKFFNLECSQPSFFSIQAQIINFVKLHHLVLGRKEFHSTLSDPTLPSSSTTQESLFVLTLALQKLRKY